VVEAIIARALDAKWASTRSGRERLTSRDRVWRRGHCPIQPGEVPV
jgi:hypothetical protein